MVEILPEAVIRDRGKQTTRIRPAIAAALIWRLLAERCRHRALALQLEVDRQRADAQELGQVLRGADREVARDLCPGASVDPIRVLEEVDDRLGDDLAVQHNREVLRVLVGCRAGRAERGGRRPSLGNRPGDVLEHGAPLIGEVEGDVGLVRGRVRLLLGVHNDVVAGQRRAILEHVVRVAETSLGVWERVGSSDSAWTTTVP